MYLNTVRKKEKTEDAGMHKQDETQDLTWVWHIIT